MKHKLGSLNMLQLVCSLLPAGATRQKKSGIGILTLSLLIMLTGQTVKAQMVVDCSGSDPTAYPTINAALANVPGPGTTILVSGTCTEDVAINGQLNLNLGAWWGSSATLRGHLTVNNSESIYLYGLNVSNAAGDGVTVYASRAVTFDTCTSDGNAGQGLNVSQNSDVNVVGPAAFDNNGSYGINIGGNSLVTFGTWNDQIIEVNNNKNTGIWMSQANFWTVGNTNIIGNASAVSGTQAVGIMEFGAARVQIGTCTGPNAIEQNQGGGINAQEASEVTLWTCYAGFRTAVANNGPVGISVGLGSQLTLADDVDITGHAGPGVDVYSNSELHFFGTNVVSHNGVVGDPRSAAIRLDGNSQALMRGGQILSNIGVGILALLNSSADFSGVTFAANTGGTINCDTSAYMVSDLPLHGGIFGPGVACRTPHNLGPRSFGSMSTPKAPDFTIQKKRQAQYKVFATPKSR